MTDDSNQQRARLLSFLAQDSDNLNLLLAIYSSFRDEGDLDQARDYLDRIKVLDADLARSHQAELYFMQGTHDEAHCLFLDELQQHDTLKNRFALAINLFYMKKLAEALSYLEIPGADLDSEQLCFIGRCYFHMGHYQSAYDALEKSLALQPDEPHALGLSALICIDLGDLAQALEKANKALALNPRVYEARLVLLYMSGDYTNKKFLDEVNRLLDTQPDDSRLWHFRGLHFFEVLNFREAEEAFNKTLELHPEFAIVQINLGLCYLLQNRESEAMSCFKQLSKHANFQAEGYGGIALVMALQGDYSNATDNIHMANAIDPSSFLMQLAEIIVLNHESPHQAYEKFHHVFADRVSVLIPVFEKLLADRGAGEMVH